MSPLRFGKASMKPLSRAESMSDWHISGISGTVGNKTLEFLRCSALDLKNASNSNLYKYISSFVSPPFNDFFIVPLPPSTAELKRSTIPACLASRTLWYI